MSIRLGPAGLGGVKEAIGNLEKFNKLGLRACEIAFTYGVYIKDKEDALRIGDAAKRLGIQLSIHAPYWINLNSKEKKKIQQSKERILRCCEVGSWLQAEIVVFHAGFYGKDDKETTYQNIKKTVLEIQDELKTRKWKIKLAPETIGKINVFGSADEILRLAKETGCSFCLDFAHLWARERGKIMYKEIYARFKDFDSLHCHFSGIDFGEKGERNHKLTPKTEIKKLLEALPKNKDITIINESPDPVGDSVKSLKFLE